MEKKPNQPSEHKPTNSFFLHSEWVSIYPPWGGHQGLRLPAPPEDREQLFRLLLLNENLDPAEMERHIQRLLVVSDPNFQAPLADPPSRQGYNPLRLRETWVPPHLLSDTAPRPSAPLSITGLVPLVVPEGVVMTPENSHASLHKEDTEPRETKRYRRSTLERSAESQKEGSPARTSRT